MKKLIFIVISSFFLISRSFAQNNDKSSAVSLNNNYISLKPSDGQPAVFNTKQEMLSKIDDKKNKIKALIIQNQSDSIKLKYYREELWRFENAVVHELK